MDLHCHCCSLPGWALQRGAGTGLRRRRQAAPTEVHLDRLAALAGAGSVQAAAAALLLAVGSNAQSSWLGSIKSWLRPSRQTRPQNGAPPLVLALGYNAPDAVVLALLEKGPEAAKMQDKVRPPPLAPCRRRARSRAALTACRRARSSLAPPRRAARRCTSRL